MVAETTFVNPAGGKIKVSPLSLKVDMSKGFGLSEVQAADPVNCYYVAINYKDGTNYVVMESNADGRHSCDVEKDNTAYSCGTLTGEYVMLFNRLVDTDQISSITVNDVEYTLGIIELVYIVLQSVVKPGITGFFKIDLHIKCYIYLS